MRKYYRDYYKKNRKKILKKIRKKYFEKKKRWEEMPEEEKIKEILRFSKDYLKHLEMKERDDKNDNKNL